MIASHEHRTPDLGLSWGTAHQFWACRISQALGLVAVLLLLVYLAA